MKLLKVVLLLLVVSLGHVYAQDETEISDDELTRYAVMMDSIDAMKENVNVVINDMIKSNDEMGGKRFKEIADVIETPDELVAIGATEDEIKFVDDVLRTKEDMTKQINDTFQTMAKDYLGDGGRTYKKIRSALKDDPETEERYEKIFEEVKKENSPEEEAG